MATSPFGTAERRVDGSGVSVSGALPAFKDDTLLLQIATGKGIGRYFNDPLSSTAVGLNDSGRLELLRITGATLYYRRAWAPGWMTVAGASSLRFDGNAPNALRRIVYASANLIHHLRPTIIVGAEVLWGRASQVDGADATNLRLQLSLRYLIF